MPKFVAERTSCATLAALSSALLGTHPVHVQSPPTRCFSIRATRAPTVAANLAAVSPPEPAPITIRSYASFMLRKGLLHRGASRVQPLRSAPERKAGPSGLHWDEQNSESHAGPR